MSLNVDFSAETRIGYFTESINSVEGVKYYRVDICSANCLCAMISFDEESGRGDLVAFFIDSKHARRCLKDGILKGWSDFHFSANNLTSEMWKVIRMIAESGNKVTIE